MVITLIKNTQISVLTLPMKVKGQFWITDEDVDETKKNIISIEGLSGKWQLKSNTYNYLTDSEGNRINERIIEGQELYKACVDGEPAYIFVENLTEDRQTFCKYYVSKQSEVSIGRSKDNDIVYDNKYVSSSHALLTFFEDKWVLSDNNSTNGTFVNDERISTRELAPGDVIYIMGFRIIVGMDFIAINNPDNCIKTNKNKLIPFETQMISEIGSDDSIETSNEYYYIAPRFKRDITRKTFRIDSPPSSPIGDTIPTIFVIGPAATMGLASVSTASFSVANAISSGRGLMTAMPSVIMAGSMLLGMIMWPLLNRKFENKKKKKAEEQREITYRDYLQEMRDQILREMGDQTNILFENNVSVKECADRILNVDSRLWERTFNQNDFLELRLGLGDYPLDADVLCSERKFAVLHDHLLDEMYAVMNEPKILRKVPITFSVKNIKVSGIIGNEWDVVKRFVKNLIIRITALHSYDELKLVFLLNDNIYEDFKFVRWLPHTWDDDRNVRFVTLDANESKEVSAHLEKIYTERLADNSKEMVKPYYVIFNFESKNNDKLGIVNDILSQSEETGFSIINICNSVINLPKECSVVIDIDEKGSRIYDKNDITGKGVEFMPDLYEEINYEEVAIKASNIQLDLSKQLFKLPNVYTFLEMFNVDKIEYLNPLMRWKENNPCQSLATPVGIDTRGEMFTLDLHEKYQGPHGLVAGMTGSGKSEFIITYILSLAVNYHPDEVAFILIDYKGGGLTGAFEYKDKGIVLPHLAGTITNLDGAAVKRSLISIQSELRRRQAIFNEARKVSNEGTMDIYRYQKLYRENVVSEPVPHLFIISDEFAELKAQQPEFMEQLISAARIGRSLGVHLILATQKPNGVVDDQIWSNTRFRVCLKVSDKADSNDMIKRPDAAELSNTGRFYLQVGFNELFALGQSAWCGAPYDENGQSVKQDVASIKVIDNIGRTVKESKSACKNNGNDKLPKQIVAIVKYLSELAKEENVSVRQLWLEPIPAKIWTSQLKDKYEYKDKAAHVIEPVIGELDDPFNQTQRLLTLPISTDGNTVIYGVAGSGKLTLLTTMLYELIKTRSVEYFNAYILDFGAETLKVFEKAPQVGGVVLSNEFERIINLFKMLKKEMESRKTLFSEYGGDYSSYIANSGKTVPNIIVVINNFTAFTEMYEECIDVVAYLTREGTKYGIYFVITSNNANSIRYRISQNFNQLFVLQLNDKSDYNSVISGGTEGTYPSKIKGRGIVKFDHTYEFQTAHINEAGNNREDILEACRLAKEQSAYSAPAIPVLPKRVDKEFLANDMFDIESVPIGVDSKSLGIVRMNIASSMVSFCSAQDIDCTVSFAQGLSEIVSERGYSVRVMDSDRSFIADIDKKYEYYDSTSAEDYVKILFFDILERFKCYKENGNVDDYKNVVYVINSLPSFIQKLSADGVDKFKTGLEKGHEKLKLSIVICDTYQSLSKYSSEAWYRMYTANGTGIWVGDGVSNQYLLKISKMTSSLYKEVGEGFGYYINKGRVAAVKVLTSCKTKEDSVYG